VVDLKNFDETQAVFQENPDIEGVIHFAAYKAVGESVEKPLLYFENNLFGLINILKCLKEFRVPYFVFSSSCTVYGTPDSMPVTERFPVKKAESPYGATKQMGEDIVHYFSQQEPTAAILLRYFNPAGAHPSNQIGEVPLGKPMNLVPAITQTAVGKLPQLTVHGTDYDTRDGSCIRDFIHVSDIAQAHTLALKYLRDKKNKTSCDIFNLGTGNGVTVLEAIAAFEKTSGVRLAWKKGPRRPGDIVAIYANNDLAVHELGWNIRFDMDEIMRTAWNWELKLKQEEELGKQQALLN
jgi:UDP-glucose 4-epimerase